MVLRPVTYDTAEHDEPVVPVWQAISRTQLCLRDAYWTIAQPDHAALAGALAGRFASPDFPQLEPEVVSAIGLHDAGWAMFPSETGRATPPLDDAGKPLSFFQIEPRDFLRAWAASISRAEESSPIGGIIVSRHFCWLGQMRLDSHSDPPEITALLRDFIRHEAERQQRLHQRERKDRELEILTTALQFCDLLSLYLCCGSRQPAEFPQRFGSKAVRARWREGACLLEPSPFRNGASLGVNACRYPPAADNANTTLGFVLW